MIYFNYTKLYSKNYIIYINMFRKNILDLVAIL